LHKMLCGNFRESKGKKLKFDDVDGKIFIKVLDLWCGKKECREVELGEVQELASVADRFQFTEVVSALEETALKKLKLDSCGEVLMWSGGCGMLRLEAEALATAAEHFEEFATTAGFMRMGEEALTRLVDDDRLAASSEEAVWEAVAVWMRGEAREAARRGVAGMVRFPLMGEEYLATRVVGMAGGEDAEWAAGVVAEALRAKAARRAGSAFHPERLGRRALAPRAAPGARWGARGEELRLWGHRDDEAGAAVACE
jgi:hypothetical protein